MATLILSLSGCHSLQQSEDATIIPQPLSVEKGNGSFSFSEKTVIAVADNEQRIIAEKFCFFVY